MNYKNIASTYKPINLILYLKNHDWRQQETVDNKFSIWVKNDFEILVPLSTIFSDLHRRIIQLLEILEKEEQRDISEIIEEINMPEVDIIRARIISKNDLDGMLLLEHGVNIFLQVRDLILSAACSAVNPRPIYAKRKPPQAIEYIKKIRLGQTKKGSYIINIFSPLFLKGIEQQTLLDVDMPFSRKVTSNLSNALEAVTNGIKIFVNSGGLSNIFLQYLDQNIQNGISANLCDAMSGMIEDSECKDLKFSFEWSRSCEPFDETRVTSYDFQDESLVCLREISNYFKKNKELCDTEVIGSVQKLEHLKNGNDKVTFVGIADGEKRTITTELCGEFQSIAIRAYEKRFMISCVGEISKIGKSYNLSNPREFKIIEQPD